MSRYLLPQTGPHKRLFVASDLHDMDLLAGAYDLGAALRSKDQLVGTRDRPLLCSSTPTAALRAQREGARLSHQLWPFGLYLIETGEYAVDDYGAYICASCRVMKQENPSLLFAPRGDEVVDFVSRVARDWDELVKRLAAGFDVKDFRSRGPNVIPFPLGLPQLTGIAHGASRESLQCLRLMMNHPPPISLIPPLLRSSRFRRDEAPRYAMYEVIRAIVITGIRDLLTEYDTDRYVSDWQTRTGVLMP
jgi:hypothetical protein